MKNTFTLIKEGRTKRISQLKHDLFSCGDKAYTLTLDALKRKEYQILEMTRFVLVVKIKKPY